VSHLGSNRKPPSHREKDHLKKNLWHENNGHETTRRIVVSPRLLRGVRQFEAGKEKPPTEGLERGRLFGERRGGNV